MPAWGSLLSGFAQAIETSERIADSDFAIARKVKFFIEEISDIDMKYEIVQCLQKDYEVLNVHKDIQYILYIAVQEKVN